MVFVYAALIGISQIGAIVCSLGSLGRGVLKVDVLGVVTTPDANGGGGGGDQETLVETAPLLSSSSSSLLGTGNGGIGEEEDEVAVVVVPPEDTVSRVRLKGSVAGVYSWCGGAAILLLTKLGGYLFDSWDSGAPFYLMAVFNGLLLLASLGIDIGRARARTRARRGPPGGGGLRLGGFRERVYCIFFIFYFIFFCFFNYDYFIFGGWTSYLGLGQMDVWVDGQTNRDETV